MELGQGTLTPATPVNVGRGADDEQVGGLWRKRQVAPGARDARAVVRAVLGVQVHRAVRAQEGDLSVILRQDLAAPPDGLSACA